jgi:hypothetical protein
MKLSVSYLKLSFFYSKTEDRNVNQVLFRDWYQWEEGGYKERVKDS